MRRRSPAPGRIGYLGKAYDSQRSSARYSCNTPGGHMTVPETDKGCSGDHHEDTCGLAMRRYDSLRSRRRCSGGSPVAGARSYACYPQACAQV